ncbi:GGDEF domain-containing protein [Marinobacterium marinum]|uniref:diguanylate cyclase n=1 Tax=Marinobacterium marinum TaxID=2756129 RepID=A0A7W2ADA4_9GAMM|nr:GGDEF domain-containing protein [Marinobacterium marinum]MBA4502978.1 diguanylate cyclase [Marinobacterium marinum]
MPEQVDWKRRYTELTRETDRQRQTDARWREELVALVRHLGMGLRGHESELDHALEALDQALQSQDETRLFPLSSRLKQQLNQLDFDREQTREKVLRSLTQWGQQLHQLNSTSRLEPAIQSVESRVPTETGQLSTLSSLLAELVELQSRVLQNAEAEVRNSEFELNRDNQQNLELLQAEIAQQLIDLLELLQIPLEGVAQARELVRELEQGVSLERLPGAIAVLNRLIRMSTGSNQGEFESYLRILNSQLSYIQQFLEESRSERRGSRDAQQKLNDDVRRDVRTIHRSVQDSQDIVHLKQTVTRQLVSIIRSMEQFRSHELEREQQRNQRYEALLRKVDEMEQETHKARARVQEEQLRARTDPLTGLPNRAAYEQHLQAEMQRWQRYGSRFSMAVGDIDFFKQINDHLGHLAGDRVLRLVARVLKHNLRSTDFIARFGGEEFVILYPSTAAEQARQATEKLRIAIQNSPFNFKGEPVRVTLSFGVAEIRSGDDAESLFVRADKALYRAKEQGRNQTEAAFTG